MEWGRERQTGKGNHGVERDGKGTNNGSVEWGKGEGGRGRKGKGEEGRGKGRKGRIGKYLE